jgi:hypothetical protein
VTSNTRFAIRIIEFSSQGRDVTGYTGYAVVCERNVQAKLIANRTDISLGIWLDLFWRSRYKLNANTQLQCAWNS